MGSDDNKTVPRGKPIKLATLSLMVGLCLLFVLVVFYFAFYDYGKDPRTRIYTELRRDFPEAEIIAPSLPPRHWNGTSERWEFPREAFEGDERIAGLKTELDELRRDSDDTSRRIKGKR